MNPPCIYLLGPFRVESDQLSENGLHARKVQELLAYLLLNHGRVQRREELAEALWSDGDASQFRKYLRQSLWRLHVAFNPAEDSKVPLLLTTPETVSINPACQIWVDMYEFENDYQRTISVPIPEMNDDCAALLRRCIGLYGGDLLEGWYSDWCAFERQRLRNCHLVLLYKLMKYYEQRQRYELCLEVGEAILRYDNACELAHRELMRIRYLMGDRIGALRQYKLCARSLHEELRVRPSELTNMLYEQIKDDLLSLQHAWEGTRVAEDLLSHLQQLEVTITSLRQQIAQLLGAGQVNSGSGYSKARRNVCSSTSCWSRSEHGGG